MGTRALIHVQGLPEVAVYKHYDGYPEGTLPWLEKFNKDFAEKRGDDPNYKLAQLLRSSVRDAEEFGLDKSVHTGWGIVPNKSVHTGWGIVPTTPDGFGEDYEYTLLIDGRVIVK